MKFFYWFRIAVKVLIPLMFLVIASIGKPTDQILKLDTANGIAGLMTVAVLFYYILVWQKVGEKKE
jgi:hypothetical protein